MDIIQLFLKVDINSKRFLLCFQYTINMGNFKLILGILKTEIGNYLSSELATLTHSSDDWPLRYLNIIFFFYNTVNASKVVVFF